MATRDEMTTELLVLAGKSVDSPERQRVYDVVGDVTVDLLSQNEGRFYGLRRTLEFTMTTADRKKRLPSNFNTASRDFYEVDEDGELKGRGAVKSKTDVFDDQLEGAYVGYRRAWIEELSGDSAPEGSGIYLVLAEAPPSTVYLVFVYYRRPERDDTDIIKNPTIVKLGAKAQLSNMFDDAQYSMAIFEKRRSGFKEKFHKRVTSGILMPSRRQARHNKRMYDRGRGR